MATILIGLDDTDNDTSPGTGRLARDLSAACAGRGLRPLGVTRHQFLVDRRIPFTSHNSGACVAVEAGGAGAAAFAFDFVAARAAPGSDPGVCVAEAAAVPDPVVAFARRAVVEVLEMAEALAQAGSARLALRALGGTGLGVIGALASVALRADGNDGRFLDLPGLRDLADRVSIRAISALGIRVEAGGGPGAPRPDDPCLTGGWVRPRLVRGEPVLPVMWESCAWVPVDRRQGKQRG
jgi:hypothetical protein